MRTREAQIPRGAVRRYLAFTLPDVALLADGEQASRVVIQEMLFLEQ